MIVHAAPIQKLQGEVAHLDQERARLASTVASNQREMEELEGNLESWHLCEAKENSDPVALGRLKREAEELPKKLIGALLEP
jgi:predicted RNase H-like nuclease (RuvC/YqgF family)